MTQNHRGKGQHRGNDNRQKSRRHKKRVYALQGALILGLSTILWRVWDVQMVYGKKLIGNADQYIDQHHKLTAPRGAILDAQGNKLAYDVPAYYLDTKTSALKPYASQIAAEIAPILGVSQSKVISILTGSNSWVRWENKILEPVQNQLVQVFKKHDWSSDKKKQWENDITFTPTEQRFYPNGDFAANALGYVDNSGVGNGGVEQEYNKELSGTPGEISYQQDAYGYPVPGTIHTTKAAVPGDTVQLTLDETVQGFVEHEMNNLVKKYQPERAAIIVTNPNTGAILGMSSYPSFNPNEYGQASPLALSSNWAVTSSFEPGSTFKPVVLAAALATNSISLYDTFKSGVTYVDNQPIHDWNNVGWGTLTYQEALEQSSNVGFAKIALALGWPNMDKYLNLFGFTKPTGVDLPNEGNSILFAKQNQHKIQLATTGFGQGISVTPLQQMAAIGVIANGGKLMKPYIMKRVTSPSGKVVEQNKPTVVRQDFIPKNVIQEVNHALVLDVSGSDHGKYGIDTAAQIPGYQVAGKTGTAQTVDHQNGHYYSDRFETSFIGYAPANNPKVEVYVTVDWPKTPESETWGSTVAVPSGRNILSDCLEYYHVPPTEPLEKQTTNDKPTKSESASYVKTPDVVGLSQSAATKKLSSLGLSSLFAGQTGNIKQQWPQPGIEVPKGSKVYGILQSGGGNQVAMPDLTGMSLRDATNLLAALGLNIAPSGTGYVTQQSVPADTKVTIGSSVSVTLKPE